VKRLMTHRSARVFAFCALTALVGFQAAQKASAQSTFGGSISGTVHDPSGTGVTGVQLTIKNLASDKTQTTTSDAAGVYKVENLMPGAY
jgi:hypothetical protein